MKNCQNCNAEMPDNFKVCGKCGTPFNVPAPSNVSTTEVIPKNAPAVQAASVNPKKKIPAAMAVVAGVVCLCLVVFVITRDKPESTPAESGSAVTKAEKDAKTKNEPEPQATELEYAYCERLDGLIIQGYKGEPRVGVNRSPGGGFEGSRITFDRMTSGELEPHVVIPETIDGKTVKRIGEYAFAGYDRLLSVTLPDSIIQIGCAAFRYCPRLSSVNFPSNLWLIEDEAFYGVMSLPDITLPDSVTDIGELAFHFDAVHTGTWERASASNTVTHHGITYTQDNIYDIYTGSFRPADPNAPPPVTESNVPHQGQNFARDY